MSEDASDRIAIVGLGLIGGSLAKAIKSAGFAKQLIAYDSDADALSWALQQGIVDRVTSSAAEAVRGAGMVVLAVPVGSTEAVLRELAAALDVGAIVTDVGSSKVNVTNLASEILDQSRNPFVPGHPIAGKENSGVRAAQANLFDQHCVILTPLSTNPPAAVQRVTEMWQATGATITQLAPEQHDLVMGATSHLPHVLAYATVNTLARLDYVDEIFKFAAGGFRDFSRIASSDPVMWRDICLSNRDAILNVLDRFETALGEIRTAIEKQDAATLEQDFSEAKRIRDDYLRKFESPQRRGLPVVSDSPQHLVVAGVPEHFNLPWHLAIEQGSFDAAQLKVEYRDYPGGTGAMTDALANREVDMAILLAEGAVADILRRNSATLVKVYVQSPLIWGIHVAAESDIHDIGEIRDRRYAISRFGSGSHLMAIVDAAERGWETEGLEFEVVKNLSGARKALASDQADAFFWERFTTQPLVDQGEFRRVGQRETLWPAFLIAVSRESLHSKRVTIRRVLEIINQTCRDLMANPTATQLIADRYELRPEQVQRWLSLTRWSVDFECPDEALQTILDYLNRLGIVNAPDASVEDLWSELG